MKIWWILMFFMLITHFLEAQTLKGRVIDKQGNPIAGATFFVREVLQGSVADENGAFQLSLKSGKYTCEISSLGFEKKIQHIEIVDKPVVLNVVLDPMVYQLKEVKVSNKGEDPAYYIMRNAIAHAPKHRNQVAAYSSEVYTKGTAKLDKVPRLLTLNKEFKKEITPYLGKLLLLESVLEVQFEAPNKYNRKVVAFSSTIPDDIDPRDALDIITASIYDPMVAGIVSPLSPGAFSYYRFRYIECYTEGGKTINKIRVEPRKKNGQLAEGWLYIAEDLWSVVYFQLAVEKMGVKVSIKSVFNEVLPDIYMPTSYDIGMEVGLLGVKAGGKYYSSVKYTEVKANHAPVIASTLAVKKKNVTKQQQRLQNKVEELAQKEELTTREAYRLADLTRQTIEAERNDTTPPLQIKSQGTVGRMVVDSMATRQDSLYWLQRRTVPLKPEEKSSYVRKDSLYKVVKEISSDSSSRSSVLGKIVWGNYIRLSSKIGFNTDGLFLVMPEYNFVDGFWLGQRVKLHIQFDKKRSLLVTPSFYYATARKTPVWEVKTQFNYAPMRIGVLKVSGGDRSTGFNNNNDTWRFENMLTSFVCADNFMKFYRKQYLSLENDIEVVNGLRLTVGGNYEKRQVLDNHISYNLFGRTPRPNTPSSEGGVDMPDNTAASAFAQLSYTPRQHYRVRNGQKIYAYSDFPTFSVRYEKGLSGASLRRSAFDRVDVSVQQVVRLGLFDNLSYSAVAGKFLHADELYFPDYKHFNTAGWLLNTDSFLNSFFLSDYYRLHSRNEWVQGGLNYTSLYLFMKRLPFLQRYLFDEAVHLRYLYTPDLKHYTECGYSLGLSDIGRLGVFVSFHGREYDGIGVRLSIPFGAFK